MYRLLTNTSLRHAASCGPRHNSCDIPSNLGENLRNQLRKMYWRKSHERLNFTHVWGANGGPIEILLTYFEIWPIISIVSNLVPIGYGFMSYGYQSWEPPMWLAYSPYHVGMRLCAVMWWQKQTIPTERNKHTNSNCWRVTILTQCRICQMLI